MTRYKPPVWLICLVGAVVLSAVIFPEIFLIPKISFLWFNDYLIDYHATFILTSFLYQGGIQLWDFFGQMPHAYFWLTHGMFKLPNLLTAGVFWIFSPFVQNSAEFFQHTFSIVYSVSLLLVRTIGMFLLLRLLIGNRWVLIGASIIGSVLFCPPAFLFGIFYQSFYPLVMYFVLSFFMTYRSSYLLGALGLLVFSFSQTPIHTCYLYLSLNLFIFACLGWSLLQERGKLRQWWQGLWKSPQATVRVCGWAALIALVILLPYVYMQAVSLKDYEFGLSQSRLSNFWDLDHYFHRLALDTVNHQDMFRRMMDFTFEAGNSFFWGYTLLFLSFVGVVMSTDRRKWIFVATLALVWFINFPREGFNVGLLGHWINALTNPFKTIVRSYHMATYSVLPYLLIPLACLGLESLLKAEPKKDHLRRWLLVVTGVVVFVITSMRFEPPVVKQYLLAVLLLSTVAWTIFMWAQGPLRRGAWALVIVLIALDAGLCVYQAKNYLTYCQVRPHAFKVRPDIGPAGLDYQNPKILPFVEQFDLYDVMADPIIWSSSVVSPSYSRVINEELMFLPPEGHSPRHAAYANWYREPWMKDYINNDHHLFAFAPYAVKAAPGLLETAVQRHLTDDVAIVEGEAPGLLAGLPASVNPREKPKDQWTVIPNDLTDETQKLRFQNSVFIWDFPLPGPLPSHLASTVFTQDHNVRFFIQSADQKPVELEPAQGWLVKPYTFDAQNIKEGKVYVALPLDLKPLANAKGILLLRIQSSSGVSTVFQHQSDRLGFNYEAPRQGWLRVRFPYDPKWRVSVDGKPVQFYKTDESFIGFPLTAGQHKVLLEYWPHAWLRWALFFSALTAMALFFILLGRAIYGKTG